jgi:hypothetical protein
MVASGLPFPDCNLYRPSFSFVAQRKVGCSVPSVPRVASCLDLRRGETIQNEVLPIRVQNHPPNNSNLDARTKVPTHTQIKGSNYDARTTRPTHTQTTLVRTTTKYLNDDNSDYDCRTMIHILIATLYDGSNVRLHLTFCPNERSARHLSQPLLIIKRSALKRG